MCTFFLVVAFRDARFLSGLYGRFSYIVLDVFLCFRRSLKNDAQPPSPRLGPREQRAALPALLYGTGPTLGFLYLSSIVLWR